MSLRSPLSLLVVILLASAAMCLRADTSRSAAADLTPAPAWSAFVAREPGDWRVRWDDDAGTPASVRARDAAPLPGWATDHGRALRDLFDRHRDLFGLRSELDQFVPVEERVHSGVTHVRLRQHHRGVPVLGGEYVASVSRDGALRLLAGGARPLDDLDVRPIVSAVRAEVVARAEVPAAGAPPAARLELAIAPRPGGAALVYVVRLIGEEPPCDWRVLVDARRGAVLEATDLALRDGFDGLGHGRVATPNPEHALRDTTLLHLRDDLARLDGRYVTVIDQQRDPTAGADGHFDFAPCTTTVTPYLNPYDEVSVYWHTDNYLARFFPSLGYAWTGAALRAHVHEASTNLGLAFSTEAGTYFTQVPTIGCCAEDADIIYHETTHSVLRTFGIDGSGVRGKLLEPLAMNEGFADYFAAAATGNSYIGEFTFQHRSPGYGSVRDIATDPAVYNYARYDSLMIPCVSPAHCCGQVWSGALWDLRAALAGVADQLALESLYYLPSVPSFGLGYDALWAADLDLHAGAHIPEIDRAMAGRGIVSAGEIGLALAGPDQLVLGESGTYSVTGMRGEQPFHYAWSQYLPPAPYGGPGWIALDQDAPQIAVACSTTTSFVIQCVATESGGHHGVASRTVVVNVPPLAVSVPPSITVPWGGCVRDTAVVTGGLPPLAYAWYRYDGIYSLVSVRPTVVDSPVTVAHQLVARVTDRRNAQVSVATNVRVPYGRPVASIRGPLHLCCSRSEPDTFLADVTGGRAPYACSWSQRAEGNPGALTSTGALLAGTALRRDSSFTLTLAVKDADGVAAVTVSRAVDFCSADSCRLQIESWREPQLQLASPVRAAAGPVAVVAVVPDENGARLDVHDLAGRRVADLGRAGLRLGTNRLAWDCRGTRPGVYFVRLTTGGRALVRRIVLLP